MNIISAQSISKAFSERFLFKNISFGLNQGDKVALVGTNGTGKTTLLKTIAGHYQTDSGEVKIRKGVRIGYLPQDPDLSAFKSIKDAIYSEANTTFKLVKEYETAISDPDCDGDRMQELLQEMENREAWDYDKKAEEILGKLGIHHIDTEIKSLSGGQKKRVAMAMMLLESPELFLLDEPTNHLDIEAIEWLENHLNGHKITLLMVTHDRYFLDNVCNQIFELDKGVLYKHEGNYAYFLEKKATREAMLQSTVDKAKNLLTKELEWMRRQPKARGTKAKYRIDAYYDLEKVAKQDLAKAEMEINIQTARQGNKVLELDRISKAYNGNTLFQPFSYTFKKKDRIGLVGKNGAGKSTFLQIITGKLTPDTGVVTPGQTTRFAYFSQHAENLNLENRIIDEVQEIAEYVTLGNGDQVSVSKLLEMFLFPIPMQYTPVSKLSGGERKRLQLLKILVTNPNFLILDEPTNDLDLDTLNVLEEFLESFDGCLLLVSHDRYFMDKLVDHIFIIENQSITDFNGNYSDFRNQKEEMEAQKSSKINALTPTKSEEKKSAKNHRKVEQLEKEITLLEEEKAKIESELNVTGVSIEKLSQLTEKLSQISQKLEAKTEEWLEADS